MNKVKDFLLSVNFTVTIFTLIGLRITFAGASIGDALAIIGICALKGFNSWLDTKNRAIEHLKVNDQVQKEITDIKSHMSALLIKNSVRPSVPSNDVQPMKRFF